MILFSCIVQTIPLQVQSTPQRILGISSAIPELFYCQHLFHHHRLYANMEEVGKESDGEF